MRKWLTVWQACGSGEVLARLADILWSGRSYLRVERGLEDLAGTKDDQALRGLRFRKGGESLDALKRWRMVQRMLGTRAPIECCMDAMAGLNRSYTVWTGDELAHVSWVAGPGEKSSLPGWPVPPKSCEIRASYTFPAYRGRGICVAVLREIVHDLAREGLTLAFAHVRPDNEPSLRAFAKVGFRVTGAWRVRCRLGWRTVCAARDGGGTMKAVPAGRFTGSP